LWTGLWVLQLEKVSSETFNPELDSKASKYTMLLAAAYGSLSGCSMSAFCSWWHASHFHTQVLHPAIEDLFKHDVWAQWDNDLKLTTWQDNEFRTYTQKAEHWQVQRAAIASAKQETLSSAALQW